MIDLKSFEIRILSSIIFSLLSTGIIISQENPSWCNYTNGEFVNSILLEENNVWIGTNGGLVKYDRINQISNYFNKANSPLPDNVVNCISRDTDGNIWIGTDNGIVVFNDGNWTIYYSNKTAYAESKIKAVRFDNLGNAWIGTYGGLLKFDHTEWITYTSINSGLQHDLVDCLSVDQNNIIWIGSKGNLAMDGYLNSFDRGNWKDYDIPSTGIYFSQVYTIEVDHDNTKWIGHSSGLAKYDNSVWTNYTNANTLSLAFSDDDIYAAQSQGFLQYKNNEWNYIADEEIIFLTTNTFINDLEINNENNIWFASSNGLYRYDYTSLIKIPTSSSPLPSNYVRNVINDSQNSVWLGTNSGIVNIINNDWILFDESNSGIDLGDNFNFPMTFDRDGILYVGTSNSIYKFENSSWQKVDEEESLICALSFDNNNHLIVGTFDGLIVFSDDNTKTYYSISNSELPDNTVRSLCSEDNNKVWIGTDTGIATYENNLILEVTFLNDQLTDKSIWAIHIDDMNNKWFGCGYSGGLVKYDDNSVTIYNTSNSNLPGNRIKTITSKNSIIWVGTELNGLVKIANGEMEVFNVENSRIPSNEINAISIDEFNNVWIALNNFGLSVYNENGVFTNVSDHLTDFIPSDPQLFQNFPNPFNPQTIIKYQVTNESLVDLSVYNLLGEKILTLVNKVQKVGVYEIDFDGSKLSSGVYIYQLTTAHNRLANKMILLK